MYVCVYLSDGYQKVSCEEVLAYSKGIKLLGSIYWVSPLLYQSRYATNLVVYPTSIDSKYYSMWVSPLQNPNNPSHGNPQFLRKIFTPDGV